MSAWTLTFQIVNFVVLAALLRRFLFRPVTAMIVKRQELLACASAEEERTRKGAEELETRSREARGTIELERERVLTEAREQAGREREASLAQARKDAAGIIEAGRTELETERESAAEVMVDQVADLATGIARRLLEQATAAPITETFLERLCTQLDGFSTERRGSLRDELDGAALFVATAPELGDDDRTRWSESIAEHLGARVNVSFVRDDSLVAGAELRFPRTILSFCWRDALRAAREEVLRHANGG